MLNHPLICFICFFHLGLSCSAYSTELPDELNIITYNVLNDRDLGSDRDLRVLNVLTQNRADFLLLQEVNRPFLERLKKDERFAQHRLYDHQQHQTVSGGLAILSRLPIKATQHYEALPSGMRRGLLYLMIQHKEQFLCIATVHLDSMMDDTPIRIKQLKAVFHHLRYCDDIILAGDFNFGQGEPEEAILSKDYQDSWLKLKPDQKGFTYDRDNNELSDENGFWLEPSRRLDRIYFKGSCLSAKAIRLVGKPIHNNNLIPPSDHYGLLATLQIQKPCD